MLQLLAISIGFQIVGGDDQLVQLRLFEFQFTQHILGYLDLEHI